MQKIHNAISKTLNFNLNKESGFIYRHREANLYFGIRINQHIHNKALQLYPFNTQTVINNLFYKYVVSSKYQIILTNVM